MRDGAAEERWQEKEKGKESGAHQMKWNGGPSERKRFFRSGEGTERGAMWHYDGDRGGIRWTLGSASCLRS